MLASLTTIDQLTKDIFILSEQGEWQAALDLQQQRKSKIQAVFSESFLIDTLEISQWVDKLLEDDQKIIQLARQRQKALLSDIAQTQKNHMSSQRYML